ncbi:MAG: PAS domain S-box protein [Bacteroidales bacterium]|nr:PAS domain S-box protein [Bacteroidales bacterium]
MNSSQNSTSKLIDEINEHIKRYESLKSSFDSLVAEQRRSQTEFLASRDSAEKRLSSIFRVAPTGIGVVVNRILTEVNPKLIEITGYSKEELIDKNSRMLYASDEEYDFVGKKKYKQIKETGSGSVETKWLRKDGEIIDVLLASTPIDASDLSKGVTFTALDITKRKRGEAKLKRSEYLLNKAQEIAHVGSWSLDLKTNKLTWSDEIFRIFGLDRNECEQTYKTFIEAVHPDDRETVDSAYRTSIEKGQDTYEIEHRVVLKNSGEVRYVIERCEHMKDSDGNITGSIGMVQDITDRKHAEEQLRKLSRAVEQSINAVIITNTKGVIEYANPAVTELTGFTNEELLGINLWPFCCRNEPNNNCDEIWDTINKGNAWKGEISNIRKNGEHYWESAIYSPIFNEQGEILNFLAIKKDVTRDKQLAEELVQAKEKAEESDRLKSAFLANISHEIRTPMNGIMGFAELLREPDLSSEQIQEYIQIIEKSGQRMLNLINDITDIARIEAGQMKFVIRESNINEIVKEIYKFFLPEAERKGLNISFITTLSTEEAVFKTDRDKLYATLSNLIKNSLKFTFKGSIDFGYHKKGELLEFFVKDTGIGIASEKQASVFERFIQADMSNSRISEGTGLGLSISKAYVEMLGGKIWMESEEGKGSTFYFTIPFNK